MLFRILCDNLYDTVQVYINICPCMFGFVLSGCEIQVIVKYIVLGV